MSWVSLAARRQPMILRNLRGLPAIALLIGLLWGCAPTGQPPFLMVQLCVVNDQGLLTFKNIMQEISRAEKMKFIDGSDETLRSYKVFRESNSSFHFATPVTHLGVESNDRMGLTASNIDVQSYNIVVGFNVGGAGDSSEARKFAEAVVGTLKRHWAVETVPTGKGAFPMESCKNGAPDVNDSRKRAIQSS